MTTGRSTLACLAITALFFLTHFAADLSAAADGQPSMQAAELSSIALQHRVKEAEIRLEQLQLALDWNRASLARAKEEDSVRIAIYERQLWYHPLILVSVIGIVATGVLLSYLQVKRDLAAGATHESSLEVTREGLKVRSPVIGLLILIVSLGFFYLYLKEVYHITEATALIATSPHHVEINPKNITPENSTK